jgi:hypothetical protein
VSWLVLGTHLIYVTQGPVHDRNLNETSPDRSDNLTPKSDARWDFHVMCHLQISAKCLCLAKEDRAVDLEYHHSDRPTGDHESGNKGRQYIQGW